MNDADATVPRVSTVFDELSHALARLRDRHAMKVQPAPDGMLAAPQLANLAVVDTGRDVSIRCGARLRRRFAGRPHGRSRRLAFDTPSFEGCGEGLARSVLRHMRTLGAGRVLASLSVLRSSRHARP